MTKKKEWAYPHASINSHGEIFDGTGVLGRQLGTNTVRMVPYLTDEAVAREIIVQQIRKKNAGNKSACTACSLSAMCTSGYFDAPHQFVAPPHATKVCVGEDSVPIKWWRSRPGLSVVLDNPTWSHANIPASCPKLVVILVPVQYATEAEVAEGRVYVEDVHDENGVRIREKRGVYHVIYALFTPVG